MTIMLYVYCQLSAVASHHFLPSCTQIGVKWCDVCPSPYFRLWVLKRTDSMRRFFWAPFFLTNIKKYIHVPVVHMLLSTFAMLDWWPYMLFWREMASPHLTLRNSSANLQEVMRRHHWQYKHLLNFESEAFFLCSFNYKTTLSNRLLLF